MTDIDKEIFGEGKLTPEMYDLIRKQFAIMRPRFKARNGERSLAEQRKSLKAYAEKLLGINGFGADCIDTEEIKNLIEDMLFRQVERPLDVYSQNWEPWLTDSRKASISWKYSDRYFQYLIGAKGWTESAASSIDISTDDILNHLSLIHI